MTVLDSKIFWIRSAERAIKTFAQSFVTLVGADQVAGFFDASITEVFLSALFATLLSFLTSLASSLKGDHDSPSLVEDKVEEQVLEKVEQGEPVGDPARVVVPDEEIVLDDETFQEPVGLLEPAKPRRSRKKAE